MTKRVEFAIRWTITATECHLLRADCSQCHVPRLKLEVLPDPCPMADSVEVLKQKFGPPPESLIRKCGNK